jgi:uncharacterized protein YdhG (YjbR/CyaY superfamily)
MTTKPKPRIVNTVDEYIVSFDTGVQEKLQELRNSIKKAAPGVEEMISYMMPAYKYQGKPLVYFAGYKNHIGFYATPTGHIAFEKELSVYKQGKGSVQFPLDMPLPLGLVSKIVKYRVKQNLEKAKVKKKK